MPVRPGSARARCDLERAAGLLEIEAGEEAQPEETVDAAAEVVDHDCRDARRLDALDLDGLHRDQMPWARTVRRLQEHGRRSLEVELKSEH